MKVCLITIGRFSMIDLARQMLRLGALERLFTAYPKFKLKGDDIPFAKIDSFPWIQGPYMAFPSLRNHPHLGKFLAWHSHELLDHYASMRMPDCDILVGLSGSTLQSGINAKKRGTVFVCHRGSSHIVNQDKVLQAERKRWAFEDDPVDPRKVAKELAEYEAADHITVPSSYARRTFIEQGIAPEKVTTTPYGVDLSRFKQTAEPDPNRFEVLFVGGEGLRKGLADLIVAFSRLKHPQKHLKVVGGVPNTYRQFLSRFPLNHVEFTGSVPQSELKDIMSRSDIMVLPSLEEGMAAVQGQALACGCPVIVTPNAGAEDLITDGVEGRITPFGEVEKLTTLLQEFADDRPMRQNMRHHALQRVKSLGGWNTYGDHCYQLYAQLIEANKKC